ncbi:fused response regulator/phosphatase [bacterium]|nr:fused response regulator/phosphatase [bacterium]
MTSDFQAGSLKLDGQDSAPSLRHVLVVDDSRLERRIIAASLRRWGFDVREAEDAQSALNMCRHQRPDLILSDWVMPGMSGPEFCQAFRDMSGERYGYFILLTSKSEATEVAHGLNAGADDFLTKPVNPHELRARISAGDRIIQMQRELREKNRVISDALARLQDVYDKIDADLIQARKIQESLVPLRDQNFGLSRITLLLEPCGHIGGDLVGMFSPDPDWVGFYSIDVSGHGITSAMMTARLGSYLSSIHLEQNVAVQRHPDGSYALREPADVASHLNARLNADTGIEEYFTLAYGTADLRTGLVRLVQAGHPHPMLLRQTGEVEFIGGGGVPVGLLPDVRFEQMEFRMQPGDRLLLYSDGLTECQVDQGEMLEEAGLVDMLQSSTHIAGRKMLDDVFWRLTERMTPETGMSDDVSALLFEYQGPDSNR